MTTPSLKHRTASTLKWNIIDRVASQILYAVTGIVLARELSPDDFGLVGAILVFQAFAALLVESGFSYALIQHKKPSETDYSTILWLNLAIASVIYVVLFFCAPLIALCFQHNQQIIPLSRVMFISLIINASSIVQTNRLVKAMDVKMITISNSIALIISGVIGITLAVTGYGAWAIVWQTLTLASIKSLILWTSQHWLPTLSFSFDTIKYYWKIASNMMATSFLNTLFQNIYSFFIGNRAGLAPLGFYTQADKWSKMGIASLSQIITSTFLPPLAEVQDDKERFKRICSKMSRFTAYLLYPATIGLAAAATPIFHLLFGTKWDPAIILFQILLLRGIFTILNNLYNNYIIAQGNSRPVMHLEILRDAVALATLVATLPFINLSTAENPVLGLTVLLLGQLLSSMVTFIATLRVTSKTTQITVKSLLADQAPYLMLTVISAAAPFIIQKYIAQPAIQILIFAAMALATYFCLNAFLNSKIQKDIIGFFLKKSPKN